MRYLALPRTKKMTHLEYKRKFFEEIAELLEELEKEDDLEALASEFMDVVQSGVNYLEVLSIDVPRANHKHIQKLSDRGILR